MSDSGCAKTAGIGCGVVLLLGVVGGAFAYHWANTQGRTMAADGVQQAMNQMVEKSELASDEKARITRRINTLVADFKAEKLTLDDLGRIAEKLSQSPLMPLAAVAAANESYIKTAQLTDAQRKDAQLQANRFARGVFERKIATERVDDVLDTVSTRDARNQRKMKEKLTSDEFKAFVATLKSSADKANIPNEEFKVDIAGEIEKAIDEALKK